MTKTIRIERRRRGIFGWIFLILFILFNLFMLVSIVAGTSGNVDGMANLTSEAERAGYAAGTAIGIGALVIFWAAGSLILGLLVLLTRGSKVIVEERSL